MKKFHTIITLGACWVSAVASATSFSFSISSEGVGSQDRYAQTSIAVYESQPQLHCLHCGGNLLPRIGICFDWAGPLHHRYTIGCGFCGHRAVYPIVLVPRKAPHPPRVRPVRLAPLPPPRPRVKPPRPVAPRVRVNDRPRPPSRGGKPGHGKLR